MVANQSAAKQSGKRFLILLLISLCLLGFGAVWLYEQRPAKREEESATEEKLSFLTLPPLLVNLIGTPGKKSHYLRLSLLLEVENPEASAEIERLIPKIIDCFQAYLRELRLEDLQGAAGLFRLKEALTLRVNDLVTPLKIKDVLFRDFLVQ